MILNKFMKRRIGTQTFTDFQIELEVKMNEIMPMYNKLFDSLTNWDIFTDGEITTHNSIGENVQDITSNSKTDNTLENESTTTNENTTSNTEKNKFSDTPEGTIANVDNSSYLTTYTNIENNGTNNTNSTDNSSSKGTSNIANTSNTQDTNKLQEETIRTPADKMSIYKQFTEDLKHIYTLIFKELEPLFYGILE